MTVLERSKSSVRALIPPWHITNSLGARSVKSFTASSSISTWQYKFHQEYKTWREIYILSWKTLVQNRPGITKKTIEIKQLKFVA